MRQTERERDRERESFCHMNLRMGRKLGYWWSKVYIDEGMDLGTFSF